MNAKSVTAMPSEADLPRLDGQLCFALYSTALAMNKLYRRLLKPLDVTYPQYLVLMVLWEQDGMTVSDIGQRLFLDSATLTPLLKRLETAGLVQRQRSLDDERQVHILLSEKGRTLQAMAPGIQRAIGKASQCSSAEIVSLRNELSALRASLLEHG